MSAIAGILRFDGRPVDGRDLERMAGALRAHGPDRSGSHAAGPVGFAHLLMRMTEEDSFDAQPVVGASGAVMVADLRLDNRDQLISMLGLDPQLGLVSSDAAIVIAAWEKWGDETWARLRGPFAIAVWNPRDRVLSLVRDPIGLRALCYHKTNDFLAFATMPKALFALTEVPRALNREKLADVLLGERGNFEATLYAGVFRSNPAHVVKVDGAGTVTKKQCWGEGNIAPVRFGSDQAYAEAMRERLDIAVRRQLRTTHKVGCFLSGGLDSSSIAALAARALASQGKRLSAYTQVPSAEFKSPNSPRRYFDERPYVEAIREMIDNLDVTYVFSGEHDDFAELDRFSRAVENPMRNVTNLGWTMQIYRSARDAGQRVLLGGDLGNMTISWDGWYQVIDHARDLRLGTAWKQIRLHYEITSRSRLGGIRQLLLDPAGIDPRRVLKLSHQRYSPINPQFAASVKRDHSARPARLARSFALASRLELILGTELRGEVEAGMLALHGVDLRDPTADLDVVEFCLGIPSEQYLAEGIDRSLVRRAMWGLLPGAVLVKRKRGLQAADWLTKIKRSSDAVDQSIKRLRSSELAAEVLDLERLQTLTADLGHVSDALSSKVIDQYLAAVPKALAIASFLKNLEA